jgi:hypothetical protein
MICVTRCYDLRLTKHLLDSEFADVTITVQFDRDRGNRIRYWCRLHWATISKYDQNAKAGMHAQYVAFCSRTPTAPYCSPHYLRCAQLRLPHVMLLVMPEGFSAAAAALQVGSETRACTAACVCSCTLRRSTSKSRAFRPARRRHQDCPEVLT